LQHYFGNDILDNLIGDKPAEAVTAFNLGHAYLTLPVLRDLAQAEHWYRRSLEMRDERDKKGQGGCWAHLGLVAYERFKEAHDAKKSEAEFLKHLNDAVKFYKQALGLLPLNAVDDLAVAHNQLGLIFYETGNLDHALPHCREAIRYNELAGNLYGAAQDRYNVAIALEQAGRLADAREYAFAALRNYETFGDRAADKIEKTKGLIAEIEEQMSSN
jgi:tetratricopeptide (TPR) repeat protein